MTCGSSQEANDATIICLCIASACRYVTDVHNENYAMFTRSNLFRWPSTAEELSLYLPTHRSIMVDLSCFRKLSSIASKQLTTTKVDKAGSLYRYMQVHVISSSPLRIPPSLVYTVYSIRDTCSCGMTSNSSIRCSMSTKLGPCNREGGYRKSLGTRCEVQA